jgi:hypothetical protein
MVSFPLKYSEQAEVFFHAYQQEKVIICPKEKISGLKMKQDRVCRFCKRKYGQVKFKQDAHIFPYALGNKYLISDFECDECNSKFGRFEDDLTKYIGISRTIDNTNTRNGVPSFVSSDLKALKTSIFENEQGIKIEGKNSNNIFQHDIENNRYTQEYTKPPYIPINVYKALLKMFLCTIDEKDVEKYSNAFQFLQIPNEHIQNVSGLMLFGYRLPNAYEDLFAVIYRKRDSSKNSTTHSFVLYYKSFMFQIFPPFYTDDIKFFDNLLHQQMPPYFDGTGDPKWDHLYQIQTDLSSTEIKTDDKEILSFAYDESLKDQMVVYDPITNKIIETEKFNHSQIRGIYLVPKDFSVKLAP